MTANTTAPSATCAHPSGSRPINLGMPMPMAMMAPKTAAFSARFMPEDIGRPRTPRKDTV